MKSFILLLVLSIAALVAGLMFAVPALAVAGATVLAAVVVHRWAVDSRVGRRALLVAAINDLPQNVGSSRESRRYLASGALATRYVFVKAGADDRHVAAIAAASDMPLGVLTDEATAAEDPVNVELPITPRTLPLVAGGAIPALQVDLYMTAAGKVVVKPTAAGTYWRVARNKTLAGGDGDPVECELLPPRKLIVVSALESTNGTAGAAVDLAALKAETEKLSDDFRKVVSALDGSADVALATT